MSATTYVIPQSVDGPRPPCPANRRPRRSPPRTGRRSGGSVVRRVRRPVPGAGATPTAASDSTVRPRSGDSSTTWSIAVTPFGCAAGAADATASDLVVGTPSRSWIEPSDGRPRNDHPTMPVPPVASDQPDADAADPADGIGVDAEPRSRPGVRWISDLELVDGDGHGRGVSASEYRTIRILHVRGLLRGVASAWSGVHGTSRSLPVVARLSMSAWACAASARGYSPPIRTVSLPSVIQSNSCAVCARSSSGVGMWSLNTA